MIYFTDWWSYGENCILQTFNGVLAGDHKMNDMCIYEDGSLKLFRDSIAKELVIDSGERGQITEKNKDDIFLNKKLKIDFNTQILFVFCEANVKEIVYSKMFECYLISYNDEPGEANTYTAVLAKKIYPGRNARFFLLILFISDYIRNIVFGNCFKVFDKAFKLVGIRRIKNLKSNKCVSAMFLYPLRRTFKIHWGSI